MHRRLLLRDRALANPLAAPPDRSGYAAASFASELAARELAAAEASFAERRVPEALACYDRALALGADFDAGLEHRWTCLMLLGQFERAWQETDRSERNRRRLALPQDHLPPHLRRVWDGTSLRGRRVRIRCFHGLGDTLQFIRYVPLVQQTARGVCIELQDALVPLLPFPRSFAPPLPPSKLRSLEIQSSPRPRNAIEHEGFPLLEKTPPTDPLVEVELMELPYIFRTTLATIPARTPYIRLPSNAIASRRRELIDLGWSKENFNVGIVWSSGNWNRERDIPLQLLAPPLATLQRVKLFSLQRNPKSNEFPPPDAVQHRAIQRYDNPWQIIQTEREVADIVATAAAISCLDLVISVDTMVAHLAGALGRPVWLLLPFHSDWRWMHGRSDSPWYPAMRLFRQAAPGDWSNVISSVAQSLREVAANSPIRRPQLFRCFPNNGSPSP